MVDPLGKLLGGVVALALLTVVHRRDLEDNCEVASRLDGYGDMRHLDVENVHIMVLVADAVVLGAGLPRLELNDEVDLLTPFYAGKAENAPDVDHSYASEFNIVADKLGR